MMNDSAISHATCFVTQKTFFSQKIPIFAHKQTGSLKHVIFLDVNVKFYSVSIWLNLRNFENDWMSDIQCKTTLCISDKILYQ